MPVNLSIKNAPDEVVARLKERAKRNHRSLQGELLEIITVVALSDAPAHAGRGSCEGSITEPQDARRTTERPQR